mmetsp:Transcript_4000/g.9212  ORF Transcript_4000/g.9212 Transcript_4000/m.9212 type:complete len:318 (-) Transcript_4000:2559-3512(-)
MAATTFRLVLLFGTTSTAAFWLAPRCSNCSVRAHQDQTSTQTHLTRPPFGLEDLADDRVVDIRTALDRMNALQNDGGTGSPSSMGELQRRIQKSVSVRESSIAGAGQGVFAKQNIKAGTVIGFYPVHGIGADFDVSSVCFGMTQDDQEYFDQTQEEDSNYVQYLIGSRRIGAADFGAETNLFIDVNPSRMDPTGGWISHFINDGATAVANSEVGMLDYYTASRKFKNCVHVPFGPAPLVATVTTKKVKKGEELFTSYGCLYWIESLLQEGEDCTEVTDAATEEAKQTAQDLFTAMQSARTMYAKQQAELQESFAVKM